MSVDPVSLAINAALYAANLAITASQEFEGPRLDSLETTTAQYGTPLLYAYGTRKLEGCPVIFAEPLHEVKRRRKTKGGKYNEYTYYGTWAVLAVDHAVDAVTRIWFDKHLIYDVSGSGPISPFGSDLSSKIRIYLGTADQDPDPRIVATVDAAQGDDSTPAYRGCTYIVFEEIPLEKLGNRLPLVSVEVVCNGTDSYPKDTRTTSAAPHHVSPFRFSPDFSRALIWETALTYEIWDVAARARMITGSFDASVDQPVDHGFQIYSLGVSALDGSIYAIGRNGAGAGSNESLIRYSADGTGPATVLTALGMTADGCRVFAYGDSGFEIVLARPQSVIWQYIAYYTALGYVAADAGTMSGVGAGAWYPRAFFQDLDSDVWVIGGNETTIYLYRLTLENPDSQKLITVAAPSTAASRAAVTVHGYHYQDSSVDQFVVMWNNSHLLTIDRASGTITNTVAPSGLDVYNTYHQFDNVRPGALSIWVGGTGAAKEISSVDLTTLRSVATSSWGVSAANADWILYDPINHALITDTAGTTMYWLYLDRAAGSAVTLQSIVEDAAERCGVALIDIDAADLTQEVRGYSWTQGTGKAIIDPLLEIFDSEARPHDFDLQFIRRGDAASGSIATAEMGAGGSKRYEISRTLDTDLERVIDLTFADTAMDQQPNTAHVQRIAAATDSSRVRSIDASTLVLSTDEARQKTEALLRRIWYKNETYKTSVTRGFSALEPGDLKTLTLDDMSRTAKLTRLEFGAAGVLSCEFERDAPGIHTESTLTGGTGDGFRDPVIVAVGYTKGFVLDVPLLTDSDEGLILYLAAGPYSDDVTWPGCIVYESPDGTDYDTETGTVPSTSAVTWGYTTGALADASTHVWDRASAVTVLLQNGELTSATEAEVELGANLAILGDELLGFTTATLTATDTYQLSGFLRGRRGTEQHTATHATGNKFVLLDDRVREERGASDVGDTIYFKPVTIGAAELTGFPQSLTYSGASLKPYSPAHLKITLSGSDKVATWVRRTRIGGEALISTTPPLGESTEAYEADVLNGSGTVIRTFTGLSSPTLTYTAAQQATDSNAGVTLKVYQISATVGRGFAASVAL